MFTWQSFVEMDLWVIVKHGLEFTIGVACPSGRGLYHFPYIVDKSQDHTVFPQPIGPATTAV